jgi:hypothetical protein
MSARLTRSLRSRAARWTRRVVVGIGGVSAAYLVLLAYPQPLFAYELNHAGITVHSTTPIPDAMRQTLERARQRLDRSPLFDASRPSHVFICQPHWLFALFARQNYNVGGVADWLVGQHVFLRESDMVHDRLVSPSGRPVAADRPLSYFIAHELMHIAHVRAVGRAAYSRMEQWVDDGHSDYVARDIDYGAALRGLREGARELDPRRSGLYIRYHLLVAYAIEKRGLDARALLQRPPARAALEQELAGMEGW